MNSITGWVQDMPNDPQPLHDSGDVDVFHAVSPCQVKQALRINLNVRYDHGTRKGTLTQQIVRMGDAFNFKSASVGEQPFRFKAL